MRLKFIVIGQTLRCVTQSNIASGTSNYIGADFDFKSDEWNELVKWANFVGDDGEVHRFCLVNDSISESATYGLNLTSGSWTCYVYGNEVVSGEIATRITTTSAHFNVNEVSETSELKTLPTEVETLVAEVGAIKSVAETAKNTAVSSSLTSEAWAVGTKNGEDVPSTDPTYRNNSKYYSEVYKPLIGESAPTTSTVGSVGQFYLYGTSLYICTAVSGTTYTWTLIKADYSSYRTAAAQDVIDAGKASLSHTHTLSNITDATTAVLSWTESGTTHSYNVVVKS